MQICYWNMLYKYNISVYFNMHANCTLLCECVCVWDLRQESCSKLQGNQCESIWNADSVKEDSEKIYKSV